MKIEQNKCPKCGSEEKQHKQGYNRSGTQRVRCMQCGKKYTLNPKNREYPEEVKRKAMQLMVDGMSGRAIGRQLGMSKANAYNWAKKNTGIVDKSGD